MSAYACEPGKGSEPWVGWNWCLQMAQLHDVTVVTRANNRGPIEASLESEVGPKPAFLYYDLPRPFVALKKRGILPTMGYYIFWQLGVALKLRKQVRHYDLVHHVTFNSFVLAGFWWLTNARTVLGPLGGGMVVRKGYLPLFRGSRWKESLRTLFVRIAVYFPPTYLSLHKASYILCANRDTLARLPRSALEHSTLLLETALDLGSESYPEGPSARKDDIVALWVGSLEPRKGLELGLRALERVPNVRLEIIGSGNEHHYLEKLADELGVANRVVWKGRVPHDEIRPAMERGDLFLFTSVRDTSGNVVLEAMSSALPVVAINHHGVAEILDDDCAILVEPGTIDETVRDLASAMRTLANDRDLRRRLGLNGLRKLAERFSWRKNRDAMNVVYETVVTSLRQGPAEPGNEKVPLS